MKEDIVIKPPASFEELVQNVAETGGAYWPARDQQELLGYAKWETFAKVIEKAKTSCRASSVEVGDHFLDVRKLIQIGKGSVGKGITSERHRNSLNCQEPLSSTVI